MIEIINANDLHCLPLGWQDESHVTAVRFDYGTWKEKYGAGTVSLRVRRPADPSAHFSALTTETDTTVLWTLTTYELEHSGAGEVQLFYTVAGATESQDAIKASRRWTTEIRDSIEIGADPPEEYERWYESLLGEAARAESYAAAANESAAEAEDSAEDAVNASLAAQAQAGVASLAATAAENARDEAEAAKTAAESARDAAAAAKTEALSAKDAAVSARTVAVAAKDDAQAYASAADEAKSDAETAKTAAESAEAAAQAAEQNASTHATNAYNSEAEVEQARQDISDSIEGVAQEGTAQTMLEKLSAITDYLQSIAENPSAGDLNGFSLNLGADNTVILSYTDPNDSTVYGSVTMPTNDTLLSLEAAVKTIADSLAMIAGRSTDES